MDYPVTDPASVFFFPLPPGFTTFDLLLHRRDWFAANRFATRGGRIKYKYDAVLGDAVAGDGVGRGGQLPPRLQWARFVR